MIAKFPNITDDKLSDFTKCEDRPVQFTSNSVGELMAKSYNNSDFWKQILGCKTEDELYNRLISANLSGLFNGWIAEDDDLSTVYFPGDNIPFNSTIFKDVFSDNVPGCILDLNADMGVIADTSISGNLLDIKHSDCVTIVEDPVYGKVMKFNIDGPVTDASNMSEIENHLPWIKISDGDTDKENIKTFSFDDQSPYSLSNTLSDDNYLILVLAKVGERRKGTITIQDSDESNSQLFNLSFNNGADIPSCLVPFLNRGIDPNENSQVVFDPYPVDQYSFKISADNSKSEMKIKTSVLMKNNGWTEPLTLSSQYMGNPEFNFNNLMGQWTLYGVSINKRKFINSTVHDESTIDEEIFVNSPIENILRYANQDVKIIDDNNLAVKACFPDSLGNINQYKDVSNQAIINNMIPRMNDRVKRWTLSLSSTTLNDIKPSESADINTFITNINELENSNKSTIIGIHCDSSSGSNSTRDVTILNNTYIKFIKVIKGKWNGFTDFPTIVSKEYEKRVFKPRMNATLKGRIDADENIPEGWGSYLYSDDSISGNYFHFESGDSPTAIFGNLLTENAGKSSFTMAAWISCNDNQILDILSAGDVRFELSANGSTDYAFIKNDDNTVSARTYATQIQLWNFPISDVSNWVAKESTAKKCARQWRVSDDQRWHHLLLTWNAPNIEIQNSNENSRRAILFVDGVSNTRGNLWGTTNINPITNGVNILPGSTFIFNPKGQSFNMKSFEIYEGDTLSGKYVADQDVFNLYLKDHDRYLSSVNGFITNYYVCNQSFAIVSFQTTIENRDFQTFPMIAESSRFLNFEGPRVLSLFYKDTSDPGMTNEIRNHYLQIKPFPNIYAGMPYYYERGDNTDKGFVVEISGMVEFTQSGIYIFHNILDNLLSLDFVKVDNPTVKFSYNKLGPALWTTTFTLASQSFQQRFSHDLSNITVPEAGKYIVSGWYGQDYGYSHCDLLIDVYYNNNQTVNPSDAQEFYNGHLNDFKVLEYGGKYPKGIRVYVNNNLKGIIDTSYEITQQNGTAVVDIDPINNKSIVIEDNVTSIGNSAFLNCNGIGSITIPDSVINIGDLAFYKCTSLTSITIPDSVTSIGTQAFRNCGGLTSVIIGNGVININISTFSGCSGLISVTIGNSVTSIEGHAFYNCSGLTSVVIPDSVTNIEAGAFDGCSNLTTVDMSSKTENTVRGMTNYPWGLSNGTTIRCSDGDIIVGA